MQSSVSLWGGVKVRHRRQKRTEMRKPRRGIQGAEWASVTAFPSTTRTWDRENSRFYDDRRSRLYMPLHRAHSIDGVWLRTPGFFVCLQCPGKHFRRRRLERLDRNKAKAKRHASSNVGRATLDCRWTADGHSLSGQRHQHTAAVDSG